jgi:hypothetical protein
MITLERRRYYLSEVIKYEEVEVRPIADTGRFAIWYGPVFITVLPRQHRDDPRDATEV